MEVLEQLAAALAPLMAQQQARQFGLKHDVAGSPISFGYSHGPGGNLSFPGVDPVVFHTVIGARSMLGQIPTTPSTFTHPYFMTVTGVEGTTGSEKTTVCADAPVAGLMKTCMTVGIFGRYERATQQLEINRLGQQNNRGDPMDLRMVGSPIDASGLFSSGNASPTAPSDLLTNEIARKFWERNVAFHRLLSVQLWQGNPDNNQSSGAYKEMTSFNILVNTGYVDAENGAACAAMDSYVSNFNNARIDLAGGGTSIVNAVTNMYYQVKDRATRMGVMPVRWVFAMRPQLFYELTSIWPCSYLTYRCQVAGNERVNVDAQDQVRFRDEMRAGAYLLIDGERVEVILDDGIDERNGNESSAFPKGCFSTDIYLIPMSVVGGQAVTFMEYFQYSNAAINEALANMALARVEGAFLTWPRQTNQCIQWQSKIEPRLILRTPWLAARLNNVVYCPVQHTRDAFPADPYFTDGGRTSRAGPSPNTIWQSS